MSNEKYTDCLGFIGDDKLPSYVGIIANSFFWPSSILKSAIIWVANFPIPRFSGHKSHPNKVKDRYAQPDKKTNSNL